MLSIFESLRTKPIDNFVIIGYFFTTMGRHLNKRAAVADEFIDLAYRIFHYVGAESSQRDFLKSLLRLLLDFSGCHRVGLRYSDDESAYLCEKTRPMDSDLFFQDIGETAVDAAIESEIPRDAPGLKQLAAKLIGTSSEKYRMFISPQGSLWTSQKTSSDSKSKHRVSSQLYAPHYPMALFPFRAESSGHGLLIFNCGTDRAFSPRMVEFYEQVAEVVGIALSGQRKQITLRERIKELTCLYGIVKVLEISQSSLHEMLREIVALVPPAMSYPDLASCRITIDGEMFATDASCENVSLLRSDIFIHGVSRGSIEVSYKKSPMREGTLQFLKEEEKLLRAIAGQISLGVSRREAEAASDVLEQQLRHADRLATIGHLAAGIAHELSEPLGNILGLSQLILRNRNLSDEFKNDVELIVSSSLEARESIRKLLIFGRQMPRQKKIIQLNDVVLDALVMVQPRCDRDKVELRRHLDEKLPSIVGDPVQLQQVVVNLLVNAAQACSRGGHIDISTSTQHDGTVCLRVKDDGEGMTSDTVRQAFDPFFTTKPVERGTGLGLSVVHGIVMEHNGTIKVESGLGSGSLFDIFFPAENHRLEQDRYE